MYQIGVIEEEDPKVWAKFDPPHSPL